MDGQVRTEVAFSLKLAKDRISAAHEAVEQVARVIDERTDGDANLSTLGALWSFADASGGIVSSTLEKFDELRAAMVRLDDARLTAELRAA